MSKNNFDRTTEYEKYQSFMESLKKERRVMFISNLKLASLIPQDYTAVLVETSGTNITVFVQNQKPLSFKTLAA